MTRPNYTDITIVLDRSGSMASVAQETIDGFNGFLAAQQSLPGDVTFSLIQFDHEYQVLVWGVRLADARPLNRSLFQPRGNTALLDAMGRGIDETGARLERMPEHERPSKVLFVVMTDGLENASHRYSRERVLEMITHQQRHYLWQFVFLGANQDAIAEAASLGIAAGSSLTYASTPEGAGKAFAAISRATLSLRAQSCATVSDFFNEQDRSEQPLANPERK